MEVNIRKVIKQKSPRLAKWIPAPLISYLRRVIHEDDINRFLENYSHLSPIEFIRASLTEMGISYHALGMEKLDPNGRYIFASNHPFGGVDGLMLADEVHGYFGDVRVIVNDLLMNIEPLKPIFVPVNKHGRQNSENLRLFNQAFDSGMPIVTFPAGLCSRRMKGEVCDLEWKTNFVKKAIASHRDVVPVYFDGHLSNFFYNLYSLRKKLGVKVNFEMLYLVDEMFKQRGQTFEIIIGDPIPWQKLNDGQSARKWCDTVRENTYSLKNKKTLNQVSK